MQFGIFEQIDHDVYEQLLVIVCGSVANVCRVPAFPACIHDCKTAVRFLRATQEDLRIRADRIAVVGSSAGAISRLVTLSPPAAAPPLSPLPATATTASFTACLRPRILPLKHKACFQRDLLRSASDRKLLIPPALTVFLLLCALGTPHTDHNSLKQADTSPLCSRSKSVA